MPAQLNDRQEIILRYIIEEYVQTAMPVGSEDLARKYKLSFSPATVRSEMAELQDKGYLYQPHVSSGRVPSDKGYRFFVNYIHREKLQRLEQDEYEELEEELLKLRAKERMLTRTLAKLLSAFSRNLAITGLLSEREFFETGMKQLVSQPEFQNTDEICQIAELLDYLDENIEQVIQKLEPKKVKTFIGRESLFTESGDCAIVISQCVLPQGEKGIVAILGPKRMEYKKNISIIENVVDFLEKKFDY